MNNDLAKFYEILFDESEAVGFQYVAEPDEDGNPKYRKNMVFGRYGNINLNFELFGSNPIYVDRDNCPEESKGHRADQPRLADCNVSKIRTFVIEFDEQTMNEQTARMNKSGMPYSTKVFSGGKGYHFLVAFETPFEDFEEAMRWKRATQNALEKYGLKLDAKCFNASRLTRAPGVFRLNTQKTQDIKELKGRVPNSEFLGWLLANDCNPADVVLYEPTEFDYEGPGDATEDERWRFVKNWANKYLGHYQTADNWNGYLYDVAAQCKAVGLDLNTATHLIAEHYEYPDQKRLRATVKNSYTYSNKTPKTINTEMNRPQEETDINIDEILNATATQRPVRQDLSMNNYAWIGTKLYLIKEDGKWEEFTSQGFKARFGTRANPATDVTRIYPGFGYEPNYLNSSERCSDGSYNTFKTPRVEIKKGSWKYTEILLRHIFGEQYELGLEYYWVKRHRPLQALPALCLVGDEDAGKTTIGQHQQMLFCNASKINSTILEKDENAYAHMCQDIIIEESTSKGINKFSNPEAIVDKIKDMVTSCGSTLPIKKLYNNVEDLPYYAKVMMFTNDITPIKMSGQATRFWVRKIGVPEKHENFLKHLENEIGAFLYFLDYEFKPSRLESKERLWFHPDEFWTEDKDTAKHHSGSRLYKTIRESLIQWFKDTEQTVCYFDLKSMQLFLLREEDIKVNKSDLRDVLEREFKWFTNPKRAIVPDSLSGFYNSKNGQNKVESRKMEYWMITENLKTTSEEELHFENLLDFEV